MEEKKPLISVCGLTCHTCPIFRTPFDKEAGSQTLMWFKNQGWYDEKQTVEDIIRNGDYCKGCRSDREDIHWSANCFILECCIDRKKLNYCFECDQFPCQELEKWTKEGEHHKKAISNLRLMKEGKEPEEIEF
jgi:hypothetical protein